MKPWQIINVALAVWGRFKSKTHIKLLITYLVHGCTRKEWTALGEDTRIVSQD
jgi:hypothetical protein